MRAGTLIPAKLQELPRYPTGHKFGPPFCPVAVRQPIRTSDAAQVLPQIEERHTGLAQCYRQVPVAGIGAEGGAEVFRPEAPEIAGRLFRPAGTPTDATAQSYRA